MNVNERKRLKTLIDYWIHHNEEHAIEFLEWVNKAKTTGDTKISRILQKAAEQMEKVNEPLSQVLATLENV